jgi:hypothetical protein
MGLQDFLCTYKNIIRCSLKTLLAFWPSADITPMLNNLAHAIHWQFMFALYVYHILLSIVRTFFIENSAEILPAHYTWKVAFNNHIHKQSIQVKL